MATQTEAHQISKAQSLLFVWGPACSGPSSVPRRLPPSGGAHELVPTWNCLSFLILPVLQVKDRSDLLHGLKVTETLRSATLTVTAVKPRLLDLLIPELLSLPYCLPGMSEARPPSSAPIASAPLLLRAAECGSFNDLWSTLSEKL